MGEFERWVETEKDREGEFLLKPPFQWKRDSGKDETREEGRGICCTTRGRPHLPGRSGYEDHETNPHPQAE